MNIRKYALFGAIILASCLTGSSRLYAQSNTFALPFALTLNSVTFGVDQYGTLYDTGVGNSAATFTFSGTSQMVWLPAYQAFRAGVFSGNQSTVGQFSVAFGLNAIASGQNSVSFGGTASNNYSVAMAGGNASGPVSFAFGTGSAATAPLSVAMGESAATANFATALGASTLASNTASTAMGNLSVASGAYSTATGSNTTANSYASFVTGQYNVGKNESAIAPSMTTWLSADPLVEFGNGTSASAKSDAFVVYKDGTAQFGGAVKVPQSGDIPMYNGTN